jgi:recombination protein RecA
MGATLSDTPAVIRRRIAAPAGAAAAAAPAAPVAPPENVNPRDTGELAAVLGDITKKRGTGIVFAAAMKPRTMHIPTGIFTLDMSTMGGIQESAITHIVGWEGGGKTTVELRAIAGAQRKYPHMGAALIDVEGTYDPEWGEVHGVNNDTLTLVQPEYAEQAIDIATTLLKTANVSMVALDSLAALMPLKENDMSVEDYNVGGVSRVVNTFMRQATQALINERRRNHFPALFLVNQFRMKIGVMHGDPRTTPGGNAPKYFASTMIEIAKKEADAKNDEGGQNAVPYNTHIVKVPKNKAGGGIKVMEFSMIRDTYHPLGAGFIDDASTVITTAKKFGVITGGGPAWYIQGVNYKFGKADEIISFFYANMDFFYLFQRHLISLYRERRGKAGDGWYRADEDMREAVWPYDPLTGEV